MLGDFLELSVDCEDVLGTVRFFEALGFTHLPTGDTWSHAYAVVSDGHINLGLHDYRFPSPSLTFVLPDLRRHVEALEATGVTFEFVKLAADEFNEAGFLTPEGQIVTLLEARTFPPPAMPPGPTLCGHFRELRLPCAAPAESAPFWERLGFVAMNDGDGTLLIRTGLSVRLRRAALAARPVMVFADPEMPALIEKLRFDGWTFSREVQDTEGRTLSAALAPPAGPEIELVTDED
jgi:hypothetical protein